MASSSSGYSNPQNYFYFILIIVIGAFIFAFATKFIWLYLLVVGSLLLIAKVANDNKPPSSDEEKEYSKILDKKEIFCESCGAKIDGDSSFCSECGTSLN